MQKGTANSDVSQRYAFPNQEGASQKVSIKGAKSLLHILFSTLSITLVELHDAQAWEDPRTRCRKDFIVCKKLLHIRTCPVLSSLFVFIGSSLIS